MAPVGAASFSLVTRPVVHRGEHRTPQLADDVVGRAARALTEANPTGQGDERGIERHGPAAAGSPRTTPSDDATAIAYETVTDANGGLPLLAPMSEVAGRLAIEAAAIALRRPTGGRGVLMGGVPGVRPAKVVVLGGGVVGTHAARMAAGLGAEVSIIDRSLPRLRQLDELFHGRVRTLASTMESIETEVLGADVVIGAVLVAGASAPKLVTRDMLPRMKRGAVLVDVSIDQGGCFETSRPTTHADPTFEVDGIIHYCVANMPGAVPVTSAQALNNATLPFVIKLANKGVAAFDDDPHLAAGLNVRDGRIMHKAVAASLGFDGASTEKVRLVAAE